MRFIVSLLTLLLFFSHQSVAQVGVNTADPEQALDVNGKIKLADDAIAPSAGTLRYNAEEGDFEGYDGNEWKSLTIDDAGPSNPVAYYGETSGVGRGESETVEFSPWDTGSDFTNVPAGKYFLITYLEYHANGLGTDNFLVKAFINVRTESDGYVNTLNFDGPAGSLTARIGSRDNPIFILRAGDYLQLNHATTSEKNFIELSARGFLVDDLDF
ncbi:MAG: hypothetical protein WA952_15465 [Lewinella sp.]